MRKLFMCVLLLAGTLTLQAQIKIGKMKIDTKKAIQAGKDAAGAITLSDKDIANMSQEYIQWMDTHNKVAAPDSELGKRLAKITANFPEIEGLNLNFAIYEVVDVNAFACGDGSIRIFAGLMELMTDDEVLAVIGHETRYEKRLSPLSCQEHGRCGKRDRFKIDRFPARSASRGFHGGSILSKTRIRR